MDTKPSSVRISSHRPLYECLTEVGDDVVSLGKQIVEHIMERDRAPRAGASSTGRQGDTGNISTLVALLEKKMDEMTQLMDLVPEYRERDELIAQLEECVENRDAVIQGYQEKIRGAEASLTRAIFQANKKLKKVAEAKANPVYSEDVIKLAHQISKSYSVAAPLFWQQGDPFRPFPTEAEFRQSTIAAPRQPPAMPPGVHSGLGLNRSPSLGSRIASPATAASAATGQMGWSPRASYPNQSPRGRGGGSSGGTPVGGWSRGGGTRPGAVGSETSPYVQRRNSSLTSPRRMSQATVPSLSQVEQMSSDSSSSSSSDEGSQS